MRSKFFIALFSISLVMLSFSIIPSSACQMVTTPNTINHGYDRSFIPAMATDIVNDLMLYEPKLPAWMQPTFDWIYKESLNNRGEEGGCVDLNNKQTSEVTSPPKPIVYTVKKGDTLYRIAKWYDTSVDQLVAENRITDPTLLQIGQKIIIPQMETDTEAWVHNEQILAKNVEKVLNATLTAYTAGFESTGKTPSHPAYGITASGAKVKEDHTIAVDPNVIPLGSLVYIEGLGIRRAEDTGSAIKGAKIDVYIPDLEEALEFGVKKNVKVYVLSSDV